MSSTYPISVDVQQADLLANLNSTTYSALIEQANKGFTLLDSITSNSNFTGIANNYNYVFTGYRDYHAFDLGATFTPMTLSGVIGDNYGHTDNYWGNLKGLYWFALSSITYPTSPTTLTYDTMVSTAVPPGSAGQITIRVGGTNLTYPVSAVIFWAEQFEFINKYLWANPVDPSLAGIGDPYIKFGIQYNAQTLVQVASAQSDDRVFYSKKKLYLSPLI